MAVFECICDTSVINRLLADIPDFGDCMVIMIPDTMVRSKEMRTNRKVQKLIRIGSIRIVKLSKRERKEVKHMVFRNLGKGMANRYERGWDIHDKIDFECAYLARKLGIHLFLFDKKAFRRSRNLLAENRSLIKDITDLVHFAAIPKKRKQLFLGNIERMRYGKAEVKLKEMKRWR